jgi:phosphoenolpyruvate carboxykinase (GTP)
MGDYFAHWLSIGKATDAAKLPRIYCVNWFRKTAGGRWLWPGFGENSRVLKWVIQRLAGQAGATATAIGNVPTPQALDTTGLDLDPADLDLLLRVDHDAWQQEADHIKEHLANFDDHLPPQLWEEYQALLDRLDRRPPRC